MLGLTPDGIFGISIHALREEGDQRTRHEDVLSSISIHALREEGDHSQVAVPRIPCDFYPRPPRGGRPLKTQSVLDEIQFLSTPSARRATRGVGQPGREYAISIHALREEGDILKSPAARLRSHFYPRPPRGGRHLEVIVVLFPILFLSTPSARRATSGSASPSGSLIFLSTPSARRATDVLLRAAAHSSISIHALREEGDYNSCRPW